jgi:macrolide transport system ATP-binding/permease protein
MSLRRAVVVCLLGGAIGIGLSALIGFTVNQFVEQFQMSLSLSSISTAVACSSLIGIVFGFLPARRAARLAPIEALARE